MTSFAAVSEYTRKLERDADSQDTADLAPQSHCTVLPLKLTSRGTQIKEPEPPPPDTVRNKNPRELLAASPQRKTLLSTTFERRVKEMQSSFPLTASWCNLEIKKRTCGGRMKALPVIGHLLSALSAVARNQISDWSAEYNSSSGVLFSHQCFLFHCHCREHFSL